MAKTYAPLILLASLCFAGQVYLRQSPWLSAKPYLIPPPQELEHFTFGFGGSVADSLWLRWIQDGDVCQTYGELYKEREAPQKPIKDLLVDNPRHRICEFSWSYQMLDAVTRLDPRFKMPYVTGLMTLTVVVEDYQGASLIYERALKAYPDDWQLAYEAAYHFLYDVGDLPRAAGLLVRAGDLGAPPWVKSLASRLYSRTGQLSLGISALESYMKVLTNDKEKEKVEIRLQELRAKAATDEKGP